MRVKLLLLLTCVYLVNIGNTQTFRGMTPNDVMVKSGAWYDVRSYNAGVATYANNGINQAIDSCIAQNGGGIIFFPPGTYTLNATITLPSNVTLKGTGKSTIILIGASSTTAFTCLGVANITIEDMQIQGVPGEGNIGISLTTNTNIIMQGLYLYNLAYGLDVVGTANENLSITDSYFNTCTTEIHCSTWSSIHVSGCNNTSYETGSLQVESALIVRTGELTVGAGDVTVTAGDVEITAGKLTIGDTLTLPGTVTIPVDSDFTINGSRVLTTNDIVTIKNPFWMGEDIFPLTSCIYKDTTYNNITGTSPIIITNVSATNNKATVDLNWIPYRKSLFDPTDTTHCWAALCINTWASRDSEPNRAGDATEMVRIDSASYSNKRLYCTYMNYSGSFILAEDDTIVIFNPFEAGWEWSSTYLLANNAAKDWRKAYVSAGPVFLHSDGYLRMIVNGAESVAWENSIQRLGMVKVHPDSIYDNTAWHILNSDEAYVDTSTAKGRGKGIVCTSLLPLNDSDGYILYCMVRNNEGTGYSDNSDWTLTYIVIDEDFNILEDSNVDILATKPGSHDTGGGVGSLSAGLGAPGVVRYGSKYVMLYTNRICDYYTYGALDAWSIWEATSDLPRGPFTTGSDSILASHNDELLSYRSCYPDMITPFIFKGHFYGLVAGTAHYSDSGSKANRQWGLAYRNERDGTAEWIEDPRSPLWINVMQKTSTWASCPPIWGVGIGVSNTYYYASDHSGGYPTFYANPNDGYIYMFMSCNAAADDYRIWGMRLNSEEW